MPRFFRFLAPAFVLCLLFAPLLNAAESMPPSMPGMDLPLPASLPSAQGSVLPDNGPKAFSGFMPGSPQHYDYRSFSGMPAWAQSGMQWRNLTPPPFGANLFQGHFVSTYYDGVNPNYTIAPGDRILLHIWGAHNYSDVLIVDQQGNIFVPEVGPVPVGGVPNGSLQSRMRQHLAATFKANVDVYANLLSSQPMSVYVTGFVARPGRYAGGLTDSILYYLDRAGGIIPERGSYRDISIQRRGKTIAKIDLYPFILKGDLHSLRLQSEDVLVVGQKGSSVIAMGLIPQIAAYEQKNAGFMGSELVQFAAPLPAVSHVSVTGTRGAEPFHIYLSLNDFASFSLAAGDVVEFLADRPGDSIMVGLSGAVVGQTRYPVKRDTTLRSLLAHVPVDSRLSNLDAVYIRRKSVAQQQKKAILDSLHRLESSVLTASSATQEGASIRVQEAQLLQNFAMRVAQVEPTGVVVVTRNGYTADILLEEGDEIVIPQFSDVVQISGEVMMPKAVVYNENMSLKRYLNEAGGLTDRADEDNILVVHPNGEVAQASATAITPGDMLLVMPRYDSKGFTIFKDVVQIMYQVAISAGVLLSL